MAAGSHVGSTEINYSAFNGTVTSNSQSKRSTSEDTIATGSSSSSGLLRHSDTAFDHSSADGTVISCTIGERASREIYISSASIGAFDPESSIRSHLSRSHRSLDTDLCGTLYEETVQLDMDVTTARRSNVEDLRETGDEIEECQESQRLVNAAVSQPEENRQASHKSLKVKADYRVGSCYHCLVNVPAGSLVAWILLVLSTIGWGVSTWLGIDKGRQLLLFFQTEAELTYEEIALIAITISTVIIAIVFLVISTFSSQKMSRYSFSSSKKNTFGYCLSVTVIVLSFLCVIFWTGMISLTMLPVGALSIIHLLVNMESLECIHPKSYGVGLIGGNSTPYADLLCNEDLDTWMEDAWKTLLPLLISIGFAIAIEACMLGFLVAASSNARHLKERMAYINEPYNYSSENINGNAKSINAHDMSNSNNNPTDTQI
ncbi:uncharacterized protein [Watersipora subatra]|uniref:uncharacterized protein isoform X2 n=1 Tax=Watersipora subatra TaxID=2589382 RepID=UPI00355B49A9